jgi:hypothetical protein
MGNSLSANVSALQEAWKTAAKDLGVSISSDELWLEGDAGSRYRVVVLVRHFGGPAGMAILDRPAWQLGDAASVRGFGYTYIGQSYETYDRTSFEDLLNDWQWTGKAEPPPWYIGVPVDDRPEG